jgi:putative DNA primase/helicase
VGKVSVLAGLPGLGKSLFYSYLAARVSTGTPFCDGAECKRGGVIVVSTEDDEDDTILPRLKRHGADLSKVAWFDLDQCDLEFKRHGGQLETLIGSWPDLRLLVIDPITGHLDGVDSHSNTETRSVLKKIRKVARRLRVAVLAITHYSKSRDTEDVNRVSGSIAFGAFARCVFAIERDQEDPSRRILRPLKHNLGPDATGLAFRIGTGGLLEWEDGEVLFANVRKSTNKTETAESWLIARLAPCPVAVNDLKTEAAILGIGWRTVENAKSELGIESYKEGDQWFWERTEPTFDIGTI